MPGPYERMVIGNGLIAGALRELENNSGVLVFASGVSNSSLDSAVEFEREMNLLKKSLDDSRILVYFSTVSVFDKSLVQAPYILHKLNVERFISENARSFCIVRLPNVVGKRGNPLTLTNAIFSSFQKSETFKVHRNASRFLMDIDDISALIPRLVAERRFHNKTVNACFDNRITMPELMKVFSDVLKAEIKTIELERGNTYGVENGEFRSFLETLGFGVSADYNRLLIEKYYGIGPEAASRRLR
jgi:nucleoside-diphosphate-sugar epimerase